MLHTIQLIERGLPRAHYPPLARLVREHFGELDRSFGTLCTPRRTSSMSTHTKHMLKAAVLPLLLAVTHALQMPRCAPPVASRAGEVHASLSTLRAPPAPPPVIGDGGGGGGGGGDPDEYLRLMEVEELHDILADWSSRGRIYHMSNNQWVQERHASGLDILERMLQDSDGESEHGRRLSLGLFEEEHVWAVAVAEVSVRRGLQVRSLGRWDGVARGDGLPGGVRCRSLGACAAWAETTA